MQGCDDNSCYLADVRTRGQPLSFTSHSGSVCAVIYDAAQQTVITGAFDNKVALTDDRKADGRTARYLPVEDTVHDHCWGCVFHVTRALSFFHSLFLSLSLSLCLSSSVSLSRFHALFLASFFLSFSLFFIVLLLSLFSGAAFVAFSSCCPSVFHVLEDSCRHANSV